MKYVAFYLGLGALFTHELDAMTNHEWRVLPLVRLLPEDVGMNVFLWLHVPLFAGIVALVASRDARVRELTRAGIAAFLFVHGALHVLFRDDPAYEFATLASDALIFGGAALGLIYLVLDFADRVRTGRTD